MGSHFHHWIDYNGVAYFPDLGVRICWQVGSLGIEKYRTICGTKMRVKYVFYIHFNKCVNPFFEWEPS